MAESAWVRNATAAEWPGLVEESRRVPVVLDFWAAWCGPCRALGPLLEKLADEHQGQFILAKVNVDEDQQLASQFGVDGIPAVFVIVDGAAIDRFVGAPPEPQVRGFIDQYLPSEADKQVAAANTADEADERRRLYESALALDPTHAPARVGLAGLLLDAPDADLDRVETLIDGVGPGGPLGDRVLSARGKLALRRAGRDRRLNSLAKCQAAAAEAPASLERRLDLGIAQAVAGDYPAALETLVGLVERDRAYGAQHAKPLAVQIFQIVGPDRELANRFRARLASALY